MFSSDGRRVPIEPWLAISSLVVWKVMEMKVSCFIGFTPFSRTGGGGVVRLHISVADPLLDKESQEIRWLGVER